uniref:Uncharacterized protein n=1 Tax=Anguilla anguilla TaxID=7936 RepID=A0A0E9TI97_ANGAN
MLKSVLLNSNPIESHFTG